jgi:1-hydroxy-2-naphthoate dioxygenase
MELSELDRWLAEKNMNGHWSRDTSSTQIKSYLWKWADIYEGLEQACKLIPVDKAGRRTIQLRNPNLSGGTSHTIVLAVQAVLPGEVAQAHRHTQAAIRFVIKGSPKCFTVVEGERFPMEAGDLLTTPTWTWHDHYNGSSELIYWLDCLDARLVNYLGARFTENYVQDRQPVEKPDNYTPQLFGLARPSWIKMEHTAVAYRYGWSEVYKTLMNLKSGEGDPYDGIRLTYVNPTTGGATLPTFNCEIQLLRPGEKTCAHRHTSMAIYHVVRGTGETKVEDETFHWEQGDIFVIGPWTRHSHESLGDEDSIIFSVTDRPALEALGLYREEALPDE